MTIEERRKTLAVERTVPESLLNAYSYPGGLDEETAGRMTENVIGRYALPVGIARNFIINGKPYAVPMVIEEPSVIAAASNGAKMAQAGGGFHAGADAPVMIGQLHIVRVPDPERAAAAVLDSKDKILALAADSCPGLIRRGGGPVDLEVRNLPETPAGQMLIVHLLMDVRDVMGANLIDTALERIAPAVEAVSGGEVRLRILSNLADHRLARARCGIPVASLGFKDYDGEMVSRRIVEAAAFAEADPYRAVTHNKGIMNGIDAALMAVGNDWRAVEAGAHAWAARSGSIKPLSHWTVADGMLSGWIELPLAVGIFGGATRVHPGAEASLRLLGVESSGELASVMASVGLAQNLAALRALSTEGIQHGHMRLHAKQMAAAAGAKGAEADRIAAQMIRENHISASYAAELAMEALEKEDHS